MPLTIIQHPDPILNEVSVKVRSNDYGSELNAYMGEMITTCVQAHGIGLAGVQVGDLRRLLVARLDGVWHKVVNPIIRSQDGVQKWSERCLSYPGMVGRVERTNTVTLDYLDPFGADQTLTLTGFDAVVIQHEIDHLDGITLYTRASRTKKRLYENRILRHRQ